MGWLGDLMKVEEFVIADVPFYGFCIPGVGKGEFCEILKVYVVSVWTPNFVSNRLCRGHRMIELVAWPVQFSFVHSFLVPHSLQKCSFRNTLAI